MALEKNGVVYIPIGCSCINQFQLELSFGKTGKIESHLFDWSITTPDSTISILKNKRPFLHSLIDIELLSNNIVRSRKEEGYIWWHLEKFAPSNVLPVKSRNEIIPFIFDFIRKHEYQIEKFFKATQPSAYYIWSNIQPNLKIAVEEKGLSYDSFYLSRDRYEKLCSAVEGLALDGAKVVFVTRKDDCDSSLLRKNNIVILDVDRTTRSSEITFESQYKGSSGLYDPVWSAIGLS